MSNYDFGLDKTEEQRVLALPFWEKELFPMLFGDLYRHSYVNKDIELDRKGVDFVLELNNRLRNPYYIDSKILNRKWDDIFVEYVSDAAREEALGWAVKEGYITDLVIYGFKPTKEFYVLDYKKLRARAIERKDEWSEAYGMRDVRNQKGYITKGIPVPIEVMRESNVGLAGPFFISGEI